MRTTLALAASAALSLAVGGGPAQAHHAIQATVDTARTVEMKVVLTKVDWINPHTWMHFDSKGANGKVQSVAVEWVGVAGLQRAGIGSANALPVGKTYTINFYPNRDGSLGGYMSSLVLPDGRTVTREGISAPTASD